MPGSLLLGMACFQMIAAVAELAYGVPAENVCVVEYPRISLLNAKSASRKPFKVLKPGTPHTHSHLKVLRATQRKDFMYYGWSEKNETQSIPRLRLVLPIQQNINSPFPPHCT
jgi:hypothetical protein